jgi:8-oxo-dGTP pyrophosphatase MutT (NUDIX family)
LVEARNASTIMLVRNAPAGLEIFMMQRHIRSDFVGGAYVFPGGAVDPDDAVDESICAGHTEASASAALGLERGGLAYWVAAIRECFEEAGVIIAYRQGGELLDTSDAAVAARFRALRRDLTEGKLSISELARREGLRLATDRVHYWARWITPEGQPRRYDTRFFLAVAPAGQAAVHDGRELTDSAWVTPRAALEKAERREWMIIFPTLRNLMLVRDLPDTAAAEAAALARSQVAAVEPRLVRDSDGIRILLPGDPGYDTEASATPSSVSELLEGSLERALQDDDGTP